MRPAEIKRIRKENEISLLELAAHTGLPASYLMQIEEGEVIPLEKDLGRIEMGLKRIMSQVTDDH